MKKILAFTEQLPYLDENGKISSFSGGVSRAYVNLFSCIDDEYEISLMYVQYGTKKGIMYQYNNKTFTKLRDFDYVEEVYDEFFLDIEFILFIDVLKMTIDCPNLPHKKIALIQTWDTEPLHVGFNGIICNGVETEHCSPRLLPLGCLLDDNQYYPKTENREDFALYTGRLDGDKNVQYLMDIWDDIYRQFGIRLKLIGPSNVYVIKIPDKFYIKHINASNDNVLLENYNKCKCFIMPSKAESFCCSLIEALSCNTPCILDGTFGSVKNFPILKNFVNGKGIFHENRLKEFIINFFSNEIKPNNSYSIVKDLFSISNNKQKIKDFIKLCLAPHPF